MIRLEHHPDSKLLSFQEERALPWVRKSGGLSSNVNAAICYEPGVQRALLTRCLRNVCRTYDAPMTRFRENEGGVLERYVLPDSAFPVTIVEMHLGDNPLDPAVSAEVSRFCGEPVAFEDDNWLRVLLIHVTNGASIVVISMPHIVSDANSIQRLIAKIWRDYTALARGQQLEDVRPRYSLRDFAGTQRAWGRRLISRTS